MIFNDKRKQLQEILESKGLKYVVYYFDNNIMSTMYKDEKMIMFTSANPSMTLASDHITTIDFPKLVQDHLECGQKITDVKIYRIKNINDLCKQLRKEKRTSVADFFKKIQPQIEPFTK